MNSSKGQITVFIALIFQVLFVFFAMLINVGMVTHDKINLQNSVDLAAYYGASKQAEILNAIAHVNYQIRQDWKLLSWRLRALGDASRSGHPGRQKGLASFNQADVPWSGSLPNGNSSKVALCITNYEWKVTPSDKENICGAVVGGAIHIPKIPDLTTNFFPWDVLTQNILRGLQDDFASTCKGMGQYNWYMAIRWMAAYRYNLANRQKFISRMVSYLKNFQDIRGESIEAGMLATLRANLTRANIDSLENESGKFITFNSMADVDERDWLPNVKIFPIIPYMDLSGGVKGSGCTGQIQHISQLPSQSSSAQFAQQYASIIQEPMQGHEEYHSSKGREKNPWYMVYVGAKAETKPRKPFFPFGDPISLMARSFAKPFGGRVGPWSKPIWLRQAGWAQEGESIDTLIPPVYNDPQTAASSPQNIPNFSRFPGDSIGLMSAPSLATLAQVKPINGLNVDYYNHLPEQAVQNPIAFSPSDANLWQRRYELAAVAPNLFDTTYYSIQPDFYKSYLEKIQDTFNDPNEIPYDLGSLPNQPFSVQGQVEVANAFSAFRQAYFKLSKWEHLLTGWVSRGTVDYSFPLNRFGICSVPPGSVATDSACVSGGRAGYSVKTIAKSYLDSNEHALGGNPGEKGPILNPPGDF